MRIRRRWPSPPLLDEACGGVAAGGCWFEPSTAHRPEDPVRPSMRPSAWPPGGGSARYGRRTGGGRGPRRGRRRLPGGGRVSSRRRTCRPPGRGRLGSSWSPGESGACEFSSGDVQRVPIAPATASVPCLADAPSSHGFPRVVALRRRITLADAGDTWPGRSQPRRSGATRSSGPPRAILRCHRHGA